MKQVVQLPRSGVVQVLDVPRPQLAPGGAIVETLASLISPGTERTKLQLGEKSLLGKARARPDLARQVVEKARRDGVRETYRAVATRLDTPAPLGYGASGVVVSVASGCDGIAPGDLVACAGGGYANHAEFNFVPKNLLARVPDGVTPEQAAYTTLGAIAMQGVRQADVRLGERVGVVGLGLVGLLAVQLARAAGGRVLAVDLRREACDLARTLGAELALTRTEAVGEVADAFTDGIGLDSVLLCAATASNDPIELAGDLCRDRGRVVVVGAVGLAIPREPYYAKELELRFSRSYGPGRYDRGYEEHGHDYPVGYVRWTEQRQLVEFLRLLAAGAVDVDALTTHRFEVARAADSYRLVAAPTDEGARPIGVLLTYGGVGAEERQPAQPLPPAARPGHARPAQVGIGMVGAGSFASRVLLPHLASDDRVRLVGVASASGLSARNAAERFGFDYAAEDLDALLEDPAVAAVVVATRHDSHAALTARALRAGKAVFCEKPLALDMAGLEEVAQAYAERQAPLFVGFNRRFSPLVARLRERLPEGVPRVVVCRVNAGSMPRTHWTVDPEQGGGRLVGELCHFHDLACSLVSGHPERVSAEALGSPGPIELADTAVVQVAFSCGSVASLQYLANGDSRLPKERIEVFCGGSAHVIDDFRALETFAGGRRERIRSGRAKGHREEMRAFVEAVVANDADASSADWAFLSSALTLAVPVALRERAPVAVAVGSAPARR